MWVHVRILNGFFLFYFLKERWAWASVCVTSTAIYKAPWLHCKISVIAPFFRDLCSPSAGRPGAQTQAHLQTLCSSSRAQGHRRAQPHVRSYSLLRFLGREQRVEQSGLTVALRGGWSEKMPWQSSLREEAPGWPDLEKLGKLEQSKDHIHQAEQQKAGLLFVALQLYQLGDISFTHWEHWAGVRGWGCNREDDRQNLPSSCCAPWRARRKAHISKVRTKCNE